jgi:hypothetical protein
VILVTTFLWSGARAWRPGVYGPQHVLGLKRMVAANLTVPHRFVCICDVPYWDALRALDIEVWPLWSWPRAMVGTYGGTDSWVRLGLLGAPGKVLARELRCKSFLMLDLDTIVRGNIDSIVQDAARARLRLYWSRLDRGELLATGHRRGYQGCIWGGRLGGHPEVWDACNAEDRSELEAACRTWIGSDQALLTHMVPLREVWDESHQMVLIRNVDDVPKWRVLFFFGASESKPWNHVEYGRLYAQLTGLPLPPHFAVEEGPRLTQLQRLRRGR